MEAKIVQMIDVAEAERVQVDKSTDGTKLWVNVDGICLLRVQRIQELYLGTEQQ